MNRTMTWAVVAGLALFQAPVWSAAQGAAVRPRLETYRETSERLPRNFGGVDSGEVFRAFKKSLASLRQGKSEKPEQLVARAADTERLLRPISTKALYAFRIAGLTAQYSAGKRAYVFGGSNGYGCPASSFREGYVACPLAESVQQDGAGEGRAAKVRRERYGLAIPIESPAIRELFQLDRNKYYFNHPLPAAEEAARRLKDLRVAVLFVGRVVGERLVGDDGRPLQPVITRHPASTTYEYDLPFQVTQVVFYVQQTGEILKRLDF